MSKRILITGVAGFVGHHVAEYFLEKTDWHITGVDSFRHHGDSMRLAHLKSNPRLKVVTHDLTTPISDRMIAEIGTVDYVLNIASESHVDRSISDPVSFVKNNVSLALEVGEYCRKIKPSVLLQMSTDEVFGPAVQDDRHEEWYPHKPSNPYAASKCAQEDILFSYWRCYGVPLIRTCTMNIFSKRQDCEKFIPMVISKVMKGETVHIHGRPGNIGSRMYLEARNLADAWLFLLKNTTPKAYNPDDIETHQQPDAYNIAGLEEIDNLTLAQKIAEFSGKELKYELIDFHSVRPGHDLKYRLDSSKIQSLGWKPPVPLWDSLREVVEWTIRPENKSWLI
jgi:dTDP-glucose 4,6-dehydratase